MDHIRAFERWVTYTWRVIKGLCVLLILLVKSFVLQKETKRTGLSAGYYCIYLQPRSYRIQKGAVHGTVKTLRTSVNWFPAVSYHTVNQDTERNPEDEGKYHDRAHYVISQELSWWRGGVETVVETTKQKEEVKESHKTLWQEHFHTLSYGWLDFQQGCCNQLTKCVNVKLVDKIPQPLDHILHLLHALSL